jgi:hypothetical protein
MYLVKQPGNFVYSRLKYGCAGFIAQSSEQLLSPVLCHLLRISVVCMSQRSSVDMRYTQVLHHQLLRLISHAAQFKATCMDAWCRRECTHACD